jgi:hypothetical protein
VAIRLARGRGGADADDAHATRDGNALQVGCDPQGVVGIVRIARVGRLERTEEEDVEHAVVGGLHLHVVDAVQLRLRRQHIGAALLLVAAGRGFQVTHGPSPFRPAR